MLPWTIVLLSMLALACDSRTQVLPRDPAEQPTTTSGEGHDLPVESSDATPATKTGLDSRPKLSQQQLAAIGGEDALALLRVTFDQADCSGIGHRHARLEVVEIGRGPQLLKHVRWTGPVHALGLAPEGLVVGAIDVEVLPAKQVPCVDLPASDGHLRDFVAVDSEADGRSVLADILRNTKE
jgi:hypothetical protein